MKHTKIGLSSKRDMRVSSPRYLRRYPKYSNPVAYVNESCHTYECVMPHIWMRHATHMNASCHAYKCVMSHMWIGQWPFLMLLRIWMCHLLLVFITCIYLAAHGNAAFFCLNLIRTKYEEVKSHICISRVTHLIEPCRMHVWNNAWMSRGTRMNVWCYTHKWIASHSRTSETTLPIQSDQHMNHITLTNEWDHFRFSRITHMNHITLTNEWDHTSDAVGSHTWIMSRIWTSETTLLIESCHTHQWVMSHT